MNLIKVNKKYTNNNLIYLEENTYKNFLILFKDIKKQFKFLLKLSDGYKTEFIITKEYLSNFYNSGKAFNIVLNNETIKNYILTNLTKYGLIRENNYFYYLGNEAYILNKYHLSLKDYIKMFK